jgi:hypothetical protein
MFARVIGNLPCSGTICHHFEVHCERFIWSMVGIDFVSCVLSITLSVLYTVNLAQWIKGKFAMSLSEIFQLEIISITLEAQISKHCIYIKKLVISPGWWTLSVLQITSMACHNNMATLVIGLHDIMIWVMTIVYM